MERGLMEGLSDGLGSVLNTRLNQTQYKTCRILPNSKSIEVYTQKGRKQHFELNGGGLESKFYRLRKMTFRSFKPNDRYYI